MTRLSATLAATALALRRLEPRPIAGGWFGGVAGTAADPLSQAGQLRCQSCELSPELIVRLPECLNLLPLGLQLSLLNQDEGSDGSWSPPASPLLKSQQERRSSQAISC